MINYSLEHSQKTQSSLLNQKMIPFVLCLLDCFRFCQTDDNIEQSRSSNSCTVDRRFSNPHVEPSVCVEAQERLSAENGALIRSSCEFSTSSDELESNFLYERAIELRESGFFVAVVDGAMITSASFEENQLQKNLNVPEIDNESRKLAEYALEPAERDWEIQSVIFKPFKLNKSGSGSTHTNALE